jgi:rod shape-determining protein MreD
VTRLLPFATTVLAMLCGLQPVHIPGYAPVVPAFALMAAYHWTIYRPDLLPAAGLFAVGMAQDLLSGELIGLTGMLLLLTRLIVLRGRRHFVNRSFAFLWAGFSLLTTGAMIFLWALHSLFAAQLLDLRVAAFRAVLTVSLFPIASYLLGRAQRALLGAA